MIEVEEAGGRFTAIWTCRFDSGISVQGEGASREEAMDALSSGVDELMSELAAVAEELGI